MLYGIGCKYVATDFTAFESLFTAELMNAVEFELYDYMTMNLDCHDEFMCICREILGGRNTCNFRSFAVDVNATRMSGEMCTSLGNGFSNLMFMLFLCSEIGSTCKGVVEGDDGLFVVNGKTPTIEDFDSLGLVIKLEKHEELETASFCGLVFDPVEQINVTNPVQALVKFGWTTGAYSGAKSHRLLALLRAKSLSMKHQFNGCPILDSLARYGLRCSHQVRNSNLMRGEYDEWQRERLRQALESPVVDVPVGPKTRLLVERLYGVTVEHQLEIEAYLDGLDEIQPLNCPQFQLYLKRDWQDYWDSYALNLRISTAMDPPLIWGVSSQYKFQELLSL